MRRLIALLVVAGCAAPSATLSPTPTASPSAPLTAAPSPALTAAASTTARPSPTSTVALASPAPGALQEIGRIRLSGAGPLDVEIDGDMAWVAMADSGEVLEVDLVGRSVLRNFGVGAGAGHLELASDLVYAGGLDTHISAIDRGTGDVQNFALGPIEGLSVDGDNLWALQKSGRVVKSNRAGGQVIGSASITIDSDAHANVVAGAESAWASGDRTAVSRISGNMPAVGGEIDTGGGIPFTFANGLVYGARPDTLWAIRPADDTLAAEIRLSGLMEILALEVDGQTAWIAARQPGGVGVVVRLNLDTGVSATDTGISLPAGIAIGSDAVWVTSYETSELVGYPRN